MEKIIKITYQFYHWGPFLYKTKLNEELVNKVLSLCKREKKLDSRNILAGHIKEEYKLNVDDISNILNPYIKDYIQASYEQRSIVYKNIKMSSAWVNYMKQSEFNPVHTHDGELSCVLYLNIPSDINRNKKNHVAKSPCPGSIVFDYGERLNGNFYMHNFFPEKGDFFIFPAWLKHYVYPFKSNKERISMSANFKESGLIDGKY